MMPELTTSDDATSSSPPYTHRLHHGLTQPISRLSISWTRGNSLRVSVLSGSSSEEGGKAMEVCLDGGGNDGADWRRIVYGSVTPFALLQSRKNSGDDWWEYVMEYSRDISLLLGGQKPPTHSLIEDPNTVLKNVEEPTCLRAAWELIEIFYADKQCQAWIPERLLDWVADYDSLLSTTQPTVHSNLVDFQKELASLQTAGVHNWKHGKKGAGVFWLQQAPDEVRLNRIAQQLFDFVGKSFSDEGFKEWEGLIELLGAESRTAGGLEFLHKYRDFKKSLQQVHDGMSSETARKTAESLILLMRNPSTTQRFWLPLLYDSAVKENISMQITNATRMINLEKDPHAAFALIIDGKTLTYALEKDMKQQFLS